MSNLINLQIGQSISKAQLQAKTEDSPATLFLNTYKLAKNIINLQVLQ